MTLWGMILVALLAFGQAPADQPGGRLTGQVVVEGQNNPLANARVTVFSMARPTGGPPAMFETTADADGRFAVENIPPGTYRVQASKAGYASQMFGSPPLIVEIAAGQTRQGVAVPLSRGGAISGRVVDSSGEPSSEVMVMALRRLPNAPAAMNGFVPAGPSAQTNDLGEYRLYGLPAGEYLVQANPRPSISPFNVGSPRGTIAVSTYYPEGRTADAAQAVVVAAGETVPNVDVRMIVAPAFQITGTVVDESGAPVPGAMVSAMPNRNPMGGMPIGFGPPSMSRSNADGSFSVPNLPAGTYALRAALPMAGGGASGSGAVQGGGLSIGASASFVNGTFSTWTTDSRTGVTFTSTNNEEQRVTIADANVDGVKITVRR